jgi:hypothetical protein
MTGVQETFDGRLYSKALSIDSRSRESGQNDNSFFSSFERFTNVVGIELISVELPNTLFDVDSSHNIIDFNYAGVKATTVTAGSYSGSQLADLLTTGMTATAGNPITVTFDEKTNKMTIAGTTISLLAGTGANLASSIYTLLGFDAIDIASYTGIQEAHNTMQLRIGENYVYLILDGIGNMASADFDEDIFGKVSIDNDLATLRDFVSVPKVYSKGSPLPVLQHLQVSLRRRDTSLYELRTNPFSFTLKITYIG